MLYVIALLALAAGLAFIAAPAEDDDPRLATAEGVPPDWHEDGDDWFDEAEEDAGADDPFEATGQRGAPDARDDDVPGAGGDGSGGILPQVEPDAPEVQMVTDFDPAEDILVLAPDAPLPDSAEISLVEIRAHPDAVPETQVRLDLGGRSLLLARLPGVCADALDPASILVTRSAGAETAKPPPAA